MKTTAPVTPSPTVPADQSFWSGFREREAARFAEYNKSLSSGQLATLAEKKARFDAPKVEEAK